MLFEMGDVLQFCMSLEESYEAVADMFLKLFPGWSGAISMLSSTQKHVDVVKIWGNHSPTLEPFPVTGCLALRSGRMYQVEDAGKGLGCGHLKEPFPAAYVCVPLLALGETLGALHLGLKENRRLAQNEQRLLGTAARNVALALANIRLRSTLRDQSLRDPLTGLFNRRYMEEMMEIEIARTAREKSHMGVIIFDLDYFKKINDKYGHDAGDHVLREVSLVVKHSIRRGDVACRYGGEEFILIIPKSSLDVVKERADTIQKTVRNMDLVYEKKSLPCITISTGIAMFPENATDPE